MRRSQSLRVFGLVGRTLGVALVLAVLIPLVWLCVAFDLLRRSPRIVRDAWADWRYCKELHPDSDYTLWRALRVQFLAWADEAGIR